MKSRMLVLCAAMLAPVAGISAEAAAGWTGKGQAGLLFSQGNSKAKSANAALDLAREVEAWKHAFHAGALYGETAGIESAQRWDAAWQSDYALTARLFAFGALRYARDRFSGFQYQASASLGAGYRFIDSETVKLTGQAGAGYRRLRPELIVKDAAGAVTSRTPLAAEGEAIATAGLDYTHALTATTALSNKLLVEYGGSNTLLTNALALEVKVSDKLALGIGVNLLRNSAPPAGLKKTDTVQTVNLVYAF